MTNDDNYLGPECHLDRPPVIVYGPTGDGFALCRECAENAGDTRGMTEEEWDAYCREVKKEALVAWEWDALFREQTEEALDAWRITAEEVLDFLDMTDEEWDDYCGRNSI
jgi:hypothetical protein